MKSELLSDGFQLSLLLQNGNADLPLLLGAGMLFPSSLSVSGIVFLPAEQLQVLPKAPLGPTSSGLPSAGRGGLGICAEDQNWEFSVISQCSGWPLLIPQWLFDTGWSINELKCCGNLVICFLMRSHSFKSTPQHNDSTLGTLEAV